MVKVISLSNPAYEKLKGMKQGQESFSDVVLKLVEKGKKKSLLEFAGVWKNNPEMDIIFDKLTEERHKSQDRKIS